MDTDITPLLTHPDRQRSRKLLESCLREINYLMTPPSIPIEQNTNQEWQPQHQQPPPPPPPPPPLLLLPQQQQQQQQQYPPPPPPQQPQQQYPPQQQRKPPPTQQQVIESGGKPEEISYVSVDNNERPTEDEELPRKLPRKVNLVTDTPPLYISKAHETTPSWDFSTSSSTSSEINNNKAPTILERPIQQRHTARKLFEKKSLGESRIFQHIHTLRSHLSCVRTLIACNSAATLADETCFISGGDDSLVKFWRVSRLGIPGGGGNGKKTKVGNFDVLPQITFRGHTGMVTCLAESLGNIWSGGSDGGIRGWKVPSATRDAYGSSSI